MADFPSADKKVLATALTRSDRDFVYGFHAMATPCEVRLETDDENLATAAGYVVQREARRVEAKFSRYRDDSVVGRINASAGADIEIEVDEETAYLLDFAEECFEVSDGLFDITSGVLRRIWHFDGSDNLPTDAQIESVRPSVGWRKVSWHSPMIKLPAGMEIDLGGLAKEYAVDKALAAACEMTSTPILVNFGGDLRVSGPRASGMPWNVAIESVDQNGHLAGLLELANGALATSGDSRRYLLKDGVRYGHILNPATGRPVKDTLRSVTVAAATCVEAGMIATLAMLQGKGAEAFLKREGVRAWYIR